ncbi:hypothetical protein AB0F73_12125 [Micromonospora purpureochromogenes]|uniref:hypothetical protein n=1 Tax=Micromonospora purpureochromogenes TaxID=47872 RepID=UPI0034092079
MTGGRSAGTRRPRRRDVVTRAVGTPRLVYPTRQRAFAVPTVGRAQYGPDRAAGVTGR